MSSTNTENPKRPAGASLQEKQLDTHHLAFLMPMGTRLGFPVEFLRHAKQSDHFSLDHSTFKNPPFHFAEYRLSGILNAQLWRQRMKPFLYFGLWQ
jgi:hypothetical protein